MAITQSRLKELLDYDPETGVFQRKVATSNTKAGEIAGCKKRVYVIISVDNKLYRAHRLAWLWMTGLWPEQFLDHINMDKHDNRWINLRAATKSQNMANRGPQRNNTSGFKGVVYYKQYKNWVSNIWKEGKLHHIGYFNTAQEAHAAYSAAAIRLFGEFARVA